ncbi:MAG TPA: four helix bundle protein [Flavobacteriales bacterium]|jgi:four helix bundle protein|nr:four helix bundle protein [Flavobacteriales bacterium]
MKGFEDLEVWKEARTLRKIISELCNSFPSEEKYKLIDQILRSSRSVTANIAEGHGRFHFQENIQFCRQARGSLTETLDHLLCAFDEEYIGEAELNTLKQQYSLVLRLLNGYISYLKKRKSDTIAKIETN